MNSSNRRMFMVQVASAGAALVSLQAKAQGAMVVETDPQAAALGYVSDTGKADTKKYPKHTPDQHCGTCALYQGKPGSAAGPCPLFAGKQVNVKGWCSAWAKKA